MDSYKIRFGSRHSQKKEEEAEKNESDLFALRRSYSLLVWKKNN